MLSVDAVVAALCRRYTQGHVSCAEFEIWWAAHADSGLPDSGQLESVLRSELDTARSLFDVLSNGTRRLDVAGLRVLLETLSHVRHAVASLL